MSTLCRAKNGDGRGMIGRTMGTKDSFRLIPLPFFCPTQLSAFLKGITDSKKFRIIRNISEIFRKNSPFSKKFRIYFFGGREEVGSRRHEWKKSNRCGGSSLRSNRMPIL